MKVLSLLKTPKAKEILEFVQQSEFTEHFGQGICAMSGGRILEPAPSAIPAATENEQHDDDDQQRRVVHVQSFFGKRE
jgi:hypothetical protein